MLRLRRPPIVAATQGIAVMRATLICLAAGAALLAACSRQPAEAPAALTAAPPGTAAPAAAPVSAAAVPSTGAPLSGVFKAVGKPATLTEVLAYKGEPSPAHQ